MGLPGPMHRCSIGETLEGRKKDGKTKINRQRKSSHCRNMDQGNGACDITVMNKVILMCEDGG